MFFTVSRVFGLAYTGSTLFLGVAVEHMLRQHFVALPLEHDAVTLHSPNKVSGYCRRAYAAPTRHGLPLEHDAGALFVGAV